MFPVKRGGTIIPGMAGMVSPGRDRGAAAMGVVARGRPGKGGRDAGSWANISMLLYCKNPLSNVKLGKKESSCIMQSNLITEY